MNRGNTQPSQQQQQLHLSPRRELQLQGPRPSPLRVSKDSHKIKKPPLPPPSQSLATREPVIIYTISPKVIHVETANFMDLIQRLTGPDTAPPAEDASSLHSPAAKLAAIHRTTQRPGADRPMDTSVAAVDVLDEFEIKGGPPLDWWVSIPGILSPVPASLPPISPAFFSPLSSIDSSFLNFLHDLSPAGFQISRPSPSGITGIFPNSPINFLSPSVIPSPGAAPWDLFNQFHDF